MKFFITGTDTGVGKTTVSVALLQAFNQIGYKTLGIKPIATGGVRQHLHLYNDDAQALRNASSVKLCYNDHNPIVFEPPIAPHLAAQLVKRTLTVGHLMKVTAHTRSYQTDVTLIEGVGGWFVPLNAKETMADFVIKSQLPVILVVGIRLGCLNHTLLTYHALQQTPIKLVGWIANGLSADPFVKPMVNTLKDWLSVPFLGYLPWHKNLSDSAIQAIRATILDLTDAR